MADKPPVFATRDPHAPAFWDERFAQGFTPWDQHGVPAAFAAFAQTLAPCPVLIPGCGSAYEALWLAVREWPVTALDFSPRAVQAARTQLATQAGGERVRLVEADFFDAVPPAGEAPAGSAGDPGAPQTDYGWIYERAFLCALPPARRGDYARRMAQLLPQNGVLAGLFFFGATHRGPPFAIEEADLHGLLSPFFECVDDRPVEGSLPVFAGHERWLTWRRRAA